MTRSSCVKTPTATGPTSRSATAPTAAPSSTSSKRAAAAACAKCARSSAVTSAVPSPEAGWSACLRDAPRTPFPDERSAAEAFSKASRAEGSAYLHARGLRPETLRAPLFAETWRVGPRGNVLFAHTDDAGIVTGFEVKNHGFTGFAAGGRKTAWQSAALPGDRALVIAESAIDALSHYQLHPEERGSTRYLSTAGQPSRAQLDVLDRVYASMTPGSTIVAAVDADAGASALPAASSS